MSEFEKNTASAAILVGIAENTSALDSLSRSLDELTRLLETAGGSAFARVVQVKDRPDARTYIGSGKVREIKDLAANHEIGLVIFDVELTPSQIQNLEEDIGEVTVIDRTMLILDIFALHAGSGEGKLQVELAQLRYTAPRLTGKGSELSRLGGGIGTRGPGESQLERDRRHMKQRIHALEEQIAEMEKNRSVMRAARDRSGIPKIAIVGYTNAGKSTLLNRLTDAGVLAEDKLFATLDPTTRRLELPESESVLLTDTVGFIRKLPHHLVKAFKSTLEEAVHADILMIVADATDDECDEHLDVTLGLLDELGASGKPTVLVYNKSDLPNARARKEYRDMSAVISCSAATGEGIDDLFSALLAIIRAGKRELTLVFPYTAQSKVSALYDAAEVLSVEYENDGIRIRAILDAQAQGAYRAFVQESDR